MELDIGNLQASKRRSLAGIAWDWRDLGCSRTERVCPVTVAESDWFQRLIPGFEFAVGDFAFCGKGPNCKGYVRHVVSSSGSRVRTILAIRERFYTAVHERDENPVLAGKASFLTAHELKHVIVDKDDVEGSLSFDASNLKRRTREAEANYFALCFLLPPEAFSKMRNATEIAANYGVSERLVQLFWKNRPY